MKSPYERSFAEDTDFAPPCPPDQTWLPYQRAGIEVALSRKNNLIADPPGLGKTVQALGIVNADPDIHSVLLICPAYLKTHWLRSFLAWDTSGLVPGIVETRTEYYKDDEGKRRTRSVDYWPDDADFVIINHELLQRHYDKIRARTWDILIIDEAHYVTSMSAMRTKQILGYKKGRKHEWILPIPRKRNLFLTGTPLLARPVDLWPIMRVMDPNGLGRDYMKFALRYCNAQRNGFGWDMTGASKTDELQRLMRERFMIRRDKKTVLPGLPDKRRIVVPLPKAGLEKAVKRESDAFAALLEAFERNLGRTPTPDEEYEWASLSEAIQAKFQDILGLDYEDAVEEVSKMGEGVKEAFEGLSQARADLAIRKAKMVTEYVQSLIDQGEKVVIFAVHKAVVSALGEAFPDAVIVSGAVAANKRQSRVDQFQTDPKANPLIGNIQAAGTGYTMTAARHAVFAEFSWLPGEMTQAEDRIWRIGQNRSVMIHHLVVEDSMDAKQVRVLCERQRVMDEILEAPQKNVVDTLENDSH